MDSIELRPATLDDIESACALINRCEAHDRVPRALSLDELREELLDSPHLDLDRDVRAVTREGELVGWAVVSHRPSDERLERAYLIGEVDPLWRGQGIGRALLGWSIERATERLQSGTIDLPKFIRVDAYDWLEDRHRLYDRFGFTPVRWFEELLRPLDDLPSVPVPDGIALRPWPQDRDEDTRAVHAAAFGDHWGSAPVDADDWQRWLTGHGTRTDLSVVAVETATDEIVAICLNAAYPEDNDVTGRRDAWLNIIGTLRPWRQRGLASAMIAWSLDAFARADFTHAALGVDADSPTGAARLYRTLGFERLNRSITHQIEVS